MIQPVFLAVLLAAPPAPLTSTASTTTAAPAARPAAPAPREMTCPIGGASFTYTRPGPQSVKGTRPDGKPIGAAAPPPLPECPDNGLVLYKDYSPEEVTKLETLIASPAYQALRASDTQYYRAYWLMKEMGVEPETYLWALLQASWQADGRPELRSRYLGELVESSAKVAPNPASLNWVGMEAHAINALRELGRFDEALSRIDMVPLQPLDVRIPAGAATLPAVQEARKRRTWLAFFKSLKTAIERKDSSLEPLDLIPRAVALERCIDGVAGLSEAGKSFCQAQATAVASVKANRDRQARELEALRTSRDSSGR
jgi:hypothetical protein